MALGPSAWASRIPSILWPYFHLLNCIWCLWGSCWSFSKCYREFQSLWQNIFWSYPGLLLCQPAKAFLSTARTAIPALIQMAEHVSAFNSLMWETDRLASRAGPATWCWPISHRFPNATLSKAMFPFSHSHSVSFKPHWTPTGVKKSVTNVICISRMKTFRRCHCHHSDLG